MFPVCFVKTKAKPLQTLANMNVCRKESGDSIFRSQCYFSKYHIYGFPAVVCVCVSVFVHVSEVNLTAQQLSENATAGPVPSYNHCGNPMFHI